MVFKLGSMKPNPGPISIWSRSNTGNELVRAIVVEPEPSKNRPNMSRYFGCRDLTRNPLRSMPSILPNAERVNMEPATSSETWVLLASRISEAPGSAPSRPIAIYVRPNVVKSRRRLGRAVLTMKHSFSRPVLQVGEEQGIGWGGARTPPENGRSDEREPSVTRSPINTWLRLVQDRGSTNHHAMQKALRAK